ncbi:MAG: ParA family protein [Acidobacteriota bacterium]|nr:ParA family protein [Acidobacteriota bacterium]
MILAFSNLKGGVGKTTSAVNLAAALARSELGVLLVDLDPQGSASYSLGVPGGGDGPGLGDVLADGVPLAEVLWETQIPGLDVACGGADLARAQMSLARRKGPTARLREALAPLARRYDFVIVDCPPGLGLLSLVGLGAARAYVVPTTPQYLALEALDRFFTALETTEPDLRPRARLLGILLTMIDHRTHLTEEVCREVRRRHGGKVFRTEIPINVRLAQAPEYGRSIFDFASWAPGALAYSRLGAEMLRRARRQGLA